MSNETQPIIFARQSMEAETPTVADGAPILDKPLVSLVIPAFNEEAVVQSNLKVLCDYMKSLEHKYAWEMVVVNDGSRDDTSALAKSFSTNRPNVFVLDHPVNFGLGQALKFGFNEARGDYIVTIDMDLSYSPDHIERLLDTLVKTHAKIVIASPYLAGGAVENVPELRRVLSVGANKFLSIASHGRLKTLTGMVRAYDAKFLRTLDFYSMGMEVNSEILYKAMVLRARIVEIPATLKWHLPDPNAVHRDSTGVGFSVSADHVFPGAGHYRAGTVCLVRAVDADRHCCRPRFGCRLAGLAAHVHHRWNESAGSSAAARLRAAFAAKQVLFRTDVPPRYDHVSNQPGGRSS
jgi:hypothetical protein